MPLKKISILPPGRFNSVLRVFGKRCVLGNHPVTKQYRRGTVLATLKNIPLFSTMKRSFFPFHAIPLALLVLGSMQTSCTSNNVKDKSISQTTTTTGTENATAGDTTAGIPLPEGFDGTQSGAEPGMTFPVLDALLYEKDFVGQIKTSLSITEEELKKLKGAAAASAGSLNKYGEKTAYFSDAKKVAQRSEGQLKTILGPERAYRLQRMVADRYAQGEISGLLPDAPNAIPTDTRVVINAPAHRMDIFKDGSLVKSYLVGIGQEKYPLPAGMRHAEYIIFNPTWTPPNEPWVRGKFAPGKVVAAGSADNPLGPVKIPIGSPSLIHGGKQPYKLGTYASHGCVGLTNDGIRDFTATLAQAAGGTAFTADSVASYGKNRAKTKWQKLPAPVPVELRYETIVAEDGNLIIYRDVYTRGTNTVAHARKVLSVYGLDYETLPQAEKTALYNALETMNRNATGKPASGKSTATAFATDSLNTDSTAKPVVKKPKQTPKEIAVPIAALAGKGYPAALDMVGRAKPKADTSGK